jgi:hypothetical protein
MLRRTIPETEMPLSTPVEREIMHSRAIILHGYARTDGQIDVEAHLTDTKPYAFGNVDRGTVQPGEPLHEMWVRMTVNENLVVTACEAVTEHGPYFMCESGAASMSRLVGLTIQPGFLRAANSQIGGTHGCTHLREMLQQIATVVLQTLWPVRSRREAAALEAARVHAEVASAQPSKSDGSGRLLNTCHAYASNGPVVQQRWPHLYTGKTTAPRTGTD